MGILWGLIAVLLAFVVVVTIFDIVRRHLGGGRTAAWILIVLLLPFVGSLAYWAMRRPTDDEIDRAVAGDREAHEGHPRPRSTRFGA